ncbi:MAG: ABC transporter substrate-binding protein [Spirochaetaceae bacterium]
MSVRLDMKRLGLLIVLVLASSALVFGAGEAEGADEVEVSFDSRTDRQAIFQTVLSEYLDAGEVTLRPLPGTSGEQLDFYTTRFAAESSTPDTIHMDIVWPATFAGAEWALPLDDYADEELKDQYLDSYIDALTVDGELVGLPGDADALMFWYREDLLEEYGFDEPPETWNELIDQAQTILEGEDDSNLQGITFQGANIEGLLANFLEFLWGNGGSILDDDGNVVIDSPEAEEALQMMIDLYEEHDVAADGVVSTATDDSRVVFQDGRAIFMMNWTYVWGQLQSDDSAVQGNVGVSTPPAFEGHEPAVCLGGYQFGVNANSRNPELAVEVISELASFDGQKEAAMVRGDMPTMKSVYEDEEVIEENPFFGEVREILATGKSRPKSPNYGEVSEAIRNELSAALGGEKSAEEALSDAADALEDMTLYQ